MRIRHPVTEPAHVLSGWKDIANYLGKGVRTVQRYEQELALPVRRPAGRSAGSVVATKTELDAWICASPIRETFDRTKPPAVSQCANSAAALKEGIAEMKRLRDEMLALRSKLKSELYALRNNVGNLRVETKRDLNVTYPPVKFEPRPRRNLFGIFDADDLIVADIDAWKRKVQSRKTSDSVAALTGTNH
jgi:hypothetical protein